MSRFSIALFSCIVAIGFTGVPAEAASLSKAEKIAVKQAIVACKAEARGKKVAWLSRRKYVNRCVAEALRDHPHIDVIQILRDHPDMKGLPMENWDSI